MARTVHRCQISISAIFNQYAMAHGCAMNGPQVCHENFEEGHLLIGLPTGSMVCHFNCQKGVPFFESVPLKF